MCDFGRVIDSVTRREEDQGESSRRVLQAIAPANREHSNRELQKERHNLFDFIYYLEVVVLMLSFRCAGESLSDSLSSKKFVNKYNNNKLIKTAIITSKKTKDNK